MSQTNGRENGKNKEMGTDSRDFKISDLDVVGFVSKPLA